MRAVVQRVLNASVSIDSKVVSQIDKGLLVFIAVAPDDTDKEARWLSSKILKLRVFADENDKMNKSILDINGEILLVSQFTLYGSCRKGNRPSFTGSAGPDVAIPLYEQFSTLLEEHEVKVSTGVFGADMAVRLVNDGPVTLVIDTP